MTKTNNKKVIALTGGGTGGHVIPLLSLYNFLKDENDYLFLWFGEKNSLESNIAKTNKIPFHNISAGKLRRYFDIKNFYEPLKNILGIFQGINYIRKHKIDIVFSKGGFVSLPLCIAAKIMKKNIYIHESDIQIGLANKIISKFATKIFTSFPKEGNKNFITTGQILNPELLDGIEDINLKINEKLKVLVIAGSQGSTMIFENLIKIIHNLQNIEFNIILGEKNKHFKEKLNMFKNITVHEFINQKELGKIYKQTDIAITRGSATVLAELYFFKIHSIIIPITNAGNHQIYNAQYYKKTFGSDMLDENKDLSKNILKKLKKYGDLRKSELNLEGFFNAMKIIEKEIK